MNKSQIQFMKYELLKKHREDEMSVISSFADTETT